MNKNPDLYIICAGMGSRMGGSIPKALVKITDKPNITTTLQQIGHKFGHVFVVTNINNQEPWIEYFEELRRDFPKLSSNVSNVPIQSGRGDGHAVLTAFNELQFQSRVQLSDECVIAWGDVFFPDQRIIDELLEVKLTGKDIGLVPVRWVDNPYVTLVTKRDKTITHAEFSKYGELNETGFHDQSVFRFVKPSLHQILSDIDVALNKNGKYITNGAEMSLLFVFHHAANYLDSFFKIKILETEYPTISFNTLEEVAQIQQEIHNKWTTANRS